MSKSTEPDEIFGPISMAAFQRDIVRRNIEVTDDETGEVISYLPACNILSIDEGWDGNSATLGVLRKILNEGYYAAGAQKFKTDIKLCILASNIVPGREMNALYDRFALRCYVHDILDSNPESLDKLMRGDLRDMDDIEATIDFTDIETAKEAVKAIKIGKEMRKDCHSLALLLRAQKYWVTTRGYTWVIEAAKAVAYLEGRDEVTKADLVVPFSTCWRTEEHVDDVRKLVEDTLVPALKTARNGLSAIRESYQAFTKSGTDGEAKTSMKRAKALLEVNEAVKEMESHRDEASADEQVLIDNIIDEATSIYAQMTGGMKRK
jgi:MoxR-like ATPase